MEKLGGRLVLPFPILLCNSLAAGQRPGTNFLNPTGLELLSKGKRKAEQPSPKTWQLYRAPDVAHKPNLLSVSVAVWEAKNEEG